MFIFVLFSLHALNFILHLVLEPSFMLCCLVILVREIYIIFNGSYIVCICFHNMCDSRILFSLILNCPCIVFYNMLMWTSE